MRVYIIAGEASGDLHASNLIKEMNQIHSTIQFRGWGGDLMQKQGVNIVKHYRELAFMGFIEVIKNLRTILKNISTCVKDIESFKPDAVILVDYPGFNLRVAEKIKTLGCKVFYYISPQVWAWKQNRVHKIKKLVDQMFVILPFEKDFYKKFNYDVCFVGHPLIDAIDTFTAGEKSTFLTENNLGEKKIIAVLPGSRKQEISVKLPVMLSVIHQFPQYNFVIAAAPSLGSEYFKQFAIPKNVHIVFGKTYSLLQSSYAAMVTSGTATLETALFNVPQVVCYKGSTISYHIAKRLIKVKYISLVNLIADKPVVTELIQHDFNYEKLKIELEKITNNEPVRTIMLTEYREIEKKLGGKGASHKTASEILNLLLSK